MWIVKLALSRPYTFVVTALAILIFGLWFAFRIPKDIFPNINTPVVSVVWSYAGMTAKEFEERITSFSEFSLSSTVNGIERIESQTLNGLSLVRIYFHPDTEIQEAMAQITATSQEILRRLPVEITPPVILLYSPSTVPIVQIMVSGENVPEQNLYDYASFRLRHLIAVIQGLTLPPPFGGKVLEMMIDTYPEALQARGLSPRDIQNAINRQNIIIPTGDAKIGKIDYFMNSNNTLDKAEDYNELPVAIKDGSIVYLKDVGFAHEGFPPQINIVRDNGERSVLLTVLKNGNASIVDIVKQLQSLLPSLQAAAPEGIKIYTGSDQSIFVKRAIENVFKETLLAILLTGGLIFLFLRNWINTLIVIVSIPLSLLAAVICLDLLGYSLNLMTLGGLALAVGILVDDATITVENIHRNLSLGKSLLQAVLDGSSQIAIPAFVSSLAICIAFLPVTYLVGASKFLFVPFAIAVVVSLAVSYFLSRTLVPVMIRFLHKEVSLKEALFFTRLQKKYTEALHWSLKNRGVICSSFALLFASILLLFPFIGTDFFPATSAGQIRLHVKAPPGTRIEVTEEIFGDVEAEIRKLLPVLSISDNIGVNPIPYTMAFGDNATIGTWDGEILVTLTPNRKYHAPYYIKRLREHFKETFPECTFFFQPADLISQILYFGLPTPIDVKVIGYDEKNNLEIARKLVDRISRIPGAVDVHLHQDVDVPELFINVNRLMLSQANLMQDAVASDLLITNSDSTVVTPNFWINRAMGLPYLIAVQTPKYRMDSIESLLRTPISTHPEPTSTPFTFPSRDPQVREERKEAELLGNLATVERRTTPGVISHYNIQPAYDIYANVQGIDLGTVSNKIQRIIEEMEPKLAPGNKIELLGAVQTMKTAFHLLGLGLIGSFLLIYFILVINFQSWSDPFIIIIALPGALTGILWALFLTHTSISIPSLMGCVVALGVATANSILIVTFANQELLQGKSPEEAAFEAGKTRLRPVLMTAGAMMFGMLPMALGIGAGAAEHAPLARAVIGGLFVATGTTLFLVPVIFSKIRKKSNTYLEAR
ncbi:MAG: efflux RND transporter permease subunit [Verrucomicrobiota bacterium]|nr:efflux RND transporter permease subunit [Verrucomicrobiota bacterium]